MYKRTEIAKQEAVQAGKIPVCTAFALPRGVENIPWNVRKSFVEIRVAIGENVCYYIV